MKCPGQDLRYWKAGDIFESACPQCGKVLEFFKDDSSRLCKSCGKRVLNPRIDYGCAAHCKFADQCLRELPPELPAERENLLKDRVAVEMKRYFDKDFKRIGHAMKVARYAEKILAGEQGDFAVVLIAAYLHDIGIKEAEKRHNSSEAGYQEELGPSVARQILENLGADCALTDEVCDIVGHHHSPGPDESINFKIVYDADCIVNLEDSHKHEPLLPETMTTVIGKRLLTATGKNLAKEILFP